MSGALQSPRAQESKVGSMTRGGEKAGSRGSALGCLYLEESAYTPAANNRTKGAEIAPKRKHARLPAQMRGSWIPHTMRRA